MTTLNEGMEWINERIARETAAHDMPDGPERDAAHGCWCAACWAEEHAEMIDAMFEDRALTPTEEPSQ